VPPLPQRDEQLAPGAKHLTPHAVAAPVAQHLDAAHGQGAPPALDGQNSGQHASQAPVFVHEIARQRRLLVHVLLAAARQAEQVAPRLGDDLQQLRGGGVGG
jgi:hypothetical protein